MAVLFACEKLHTYTFGRKTTVHTDHKPLQNILLKPISLAPARLQRMLLRLSKYDIQVVYVGSKSVLLADTLSRLVEQGSAREIPGLDVSIGQVLKMEPTRLESLQEDTKADPTLTELTDLILTGWPNSMQDIPEHLHPYWCFRDELTILDGLIMKGNRVVIPTSMRSATLNRLHDAHQGLTSMLRRARRTVYWPKLQDDITDMVHKCDEEEAQTSRRQISATRPMEILVMDLVDFRGKHALVTVDYFSGFLTYDTLESETTETVTKVLNNIFRKFGLPEKIISDNGPCFRSNNFRRFCDQLDTRHVTYSPYYHQSNGRAERAVATIEQILKKSASDMDITKALTSYLDTPVSDTLPSPAELFHNRRINPRLSMAMTPAPLTDQQKTHLSDKRSAHLKSSKQDNNIYLPSQAIWFTDDSSDEWKPGYTEAKDITPDSYWITSGKNSRRFRRNKHDIKPRYITITQQRPMPKVPVRYPAHLSDDDAASAIPEVQEPVSPSADTPTTFGKSPPASNNQNTATPTNNPDVGKIRTPADLTPMLTRSPSGRLIKPTRNPDFVYNPV